MAGRSFDADVLIAGGGPAGSAAAIACAEKGLRVVLCERDTFARERPGETLHPGIEPLLVQLGVAERLEAVTGARHDGIWIEWGGQRRFEPFGSDASGPWSGFQVWRADFDQMLIERARELGVDVRQPCAVRDIAARGPQCMTIETDAGRISARVLIDATGRSRWLGRMLRIDSPPHSPRYFARYGYVQGHCPARDEAPALVASSTGWTWTARVRPNLYQWTHLAFDGTQPDPSWMPEEFRGLAPLGPSRGADVTWRKSARAADSGWFMVGDAAAILDPTSSHGVLKAIMSGIMASHLVAAQISGRAPAREAAVAYRSWLGGWFDADATRLAGYYRMLETSRFGQNSA